MFPKTELTKRAYLIACDAHFGQCDKAGQPYILHPLAVADQFDDERLAAAALLHDVLEDSLEWTTARLYGHGIPPDIVRLVQTLTRREDETYFDYIRRIKPDPDATAIKTADLRHNLRRSETFTADLESLRKRYEKAIEILETESDKE